MPRGVCGRDQSQSVLPFACVRDGAVGVFGATRYVGRAVGALLLGLAVKLSRAHGSAIGAEPGGRRGLSSIVDESRLVGVAETVAILFALLFGLANGWNDALFYVLAMEASTPGWPPRPVRFSCR